MSLVFALAIYFVIWWIVLFAMLPFGVRTSEEMGETNSPGCADSAPHRPRLIPKMIATTIVSAIVFAGIYAAIVHRVVTLDHIPSLPRYESAREAG